jgi:hypothetical protein
MVGTPPTNGVPTVSKRDPKLPPKQSPKVTVKGSTYTAHCVYAGCKTTRQGQNKETAIQTLAGHIQAVHGDSRYLR